MYKNRNVTEKKERNTYEHRFRLGSHQQLELPRAGGCPPMAPYTPPHPHWEELRFLARVLSMAMRVSFSLSLVAPLKLRFFFSFLLYFFPSLFSNPPQPPIFLSCVLGHWIVGGGDWVWVWGGLGIGDWGLRIGCGRLTSSKFRRRPTSDERSGGWVWGGYVNILYTCVGSEGKKIQRRGEKKAVALRRSWEM